ncbi:unnamed protein product [Spirodela intermedia]|uniref:Uncharacterized protein n=1 Tax=Spirodela intermedia TaxID=51605 RepID=A0A7I8IRP3_SPIIN|nr:unnamed protein product [Spirodela intermedia]CAA6660455.1 unnamed protein product [Spirodela intermedia]
MGGLCSKRSAVDKSPSESTLQANGYRNPEPLVFQSGGFPRKTQEITNPPNVGDTTDKKFREQPFSFSEGITPISRDVLDDAGQLREPQLSRVLSQKSRSTTSKLSSPAKTGTTKVSEVSSLLGRAGTVGLGKAVEVLDTLGSSMTNLNMSAGFVSGMTMKGNKIAILSFEVANTIVKGSNLMQSLSKESIKHLKEVVLPSEGVQRLISKDTDELLRIAASDKRDELKVFSGEVVRFGNRCKDLMLDSFVLPLCRLGSELTPQKQLKEDAEVTMQQLMTMVQYTAELYHELHALDRFEQDYKRKQQEENSNSAQRGDNLQILRQELKSQKKHVKNLKKKITLVMEKLVDIVHVLHLEIHEAFGSADNDTPLGGSFCTHQRLGSAGLALHYANVISQIDTLVSRSSSIPPNTRDTLYQGLPPSIKSALRSRLQSFQIKEELTVAQIKDEMEKTLRWLVPIANNTTKAHHGFGWVGEWANTGSELSRKQAGQTDLIRIETLHHADKNKTEAYILDLVVWLHHLVSQSRAGNGIRSPIKSPIRSPINQPSSNRSSTPSPILSQEDKEMLREVYYRRLTPGISKSQEFGPSRTRLSKHNRLSKSISYSPHSGADKELASPPARRPSMLPVINFDIDRNKALDVIDRLDGLRN